MKTYHTNHAVITVPIIPTYMHCINTDGSLIFCLIRCAQPKENTHLSWSLTQNILLCMWFSRKLRFN